jgi:hypothetical protein
MACYSQSDLLFLADAATSSPPVHASGLASSYIGGTYRAKPFADLRNHESMRMINSWMCPWLNAVYGKNFADQDNAAAEVAMEMIKEMIVRNELGGFTTEKYAEAFAGNRMEMLAFSKFVLGRVSDVFVFVDLHLVISTQ